MSARTARLPIVRNEVRKTMSFTPGQQRCINTLDRSLVVAAGAGSGKTFTLTKRIVHAIQSGAVDGIDRICAIDRKSVV